MMEASNEFDAVILMIQTITQSIQQQSLNDNRKEGRCSMAGSQQHRMEEKARKEELLRLQMEQQREADEKYMKEAIRQARRAARLGEVPIGCVIVHEDQIIGRG